MRPARSPRAASACVPCSCSSAEVRATACSPPAAAVELLHMATLVHDDVLDQAPLRRGVPTVSATAGRAAAIATGDLLFSRAFAELASTGSEDAVSALSAASSSLARGELMQRADAWSDHVTRRALPRALRAEDGEPLLRRVPTRRAARRLAGCPGGPCHVRPPHRPRLPDPRRRARRLGSERSHRQAPRNGPARWHRHPAADHRAGARSRPAADGPQGAGHRARPGGVGMRPDHAHRRASARRASRRSFRWRRPMPRSAGWRLPENRRRALDLVAEAVVERYA